MRALGIAAAAFTCGWFVACQIGSTFRCQSDTQCVEGDVAGVCQSDGLCAGPDSACDSGWRYYELSGARSGRCVEVDDGTSTGSTAAETSAPDSSSSTGAITTVSLQESGGDTTSGAPTTGGLRDTTDGDSSSSTGAPVDDSLVLWLRFDDDVRRGGLQDASLFDNHGECVDASCPLTTEGVQGTALAFDGLDDFVRVPHNASFESPDAFSIAVWVRLAAPPSEQRSFLTKTVGDSVSNSWELYYFPGGSCTGCARFSVLTPDGERTVTSPNPSPAGEWVHVAGTFDGTTIILWVNGEPVGSEIVEAVEFDDHPVLVGVDDDNDAFGYDGYFDGDIDDVRVYNRALGEAEVLDLATP